MRGVCGGVGEEWRKDGERRLDVRIIRFVMAGMWSRVLDTLYYKHQASHYLSYSILSCSPLHSPQRKSLSSRSTGYINRHCAANRSQID